ncbi:hypothetical protein NPIL_574091 [Nephila pilipes]|uniref:Uncharacterized protein n=1 Tax=Nephila pilipes TaxID=299642 RepID=A0A8X6URD2_NEPPI|nr:hypothetical protein NPIL_574091 [Nephila pilipes]
MNFGDFLSKLAHILGILGNGNTTTTDITSPGNFMSSSTPMIIDTSTLTQYRTTEDPHSISTKFISSLSTGSTYETTFKDKSTPDYSSTFSTGSPKVSEPTPTVQTSPSSLPTGSDTSPTGTVPTGSETSPTGTVPTGSETTPTGTVPTGSGTTPTGTVPTGSESTPTGQASTSSPAPTGSESTPTGQPPTSSPGPTGSDPTVKPTGSTDKGGLSRGAVAGIVIGCLLVLAIVTAAIVFVVKNRRGPESQRLNV